MIVNEKEFLGKIVVLLEADEDQAPATADQDQEEEQPKKQGWLSKQIQKTANNAVDRIRYAVGDHKALGRLNFNLASKKLKQDWDHYIGMRSKTDDSHPTFQTLLDFLKWDYAITPKDGMSFGNPHAPLDFEKFLPKLTDMLIQQGKIVVGRGDQVYKNVSVSSDDNKNKDKEKATDHDDDAEYEAVLIDPEEPYSNESIIKRFNLFFNTVDFSEARKQVKLGNSDLTKFYEGFFSNTEEVTNAMKSTEKRNEVANIIGSLLFAFCRGISGGEESIEDIKDNTDAMKKAERMKKCLATYNLEDPRFFNALMSNCTSKQAASAYVLKTEEKYFESNTALTMAILEYLGIKKPKAPE